MCLVAPQHFCCTAGQRQPWDLGRFVQTVTYFNQPPSAEQVLKALVEQPAKLARQLTGGNLEARSSHLDVQPLCTDLAQTPAHSLPFSIKH